MTHKAIEAAIKSSVIAARNCGYDLPHSVVRAIVKTYEQALWRPIDDGAKTGGQLIVLEQGKHAFLARWWNCYSPFYRSEVRGFWTSTDPSQAHVILPEDATHYRPLPPMPGNDG